MNSSGAPRSPGLETTTDILTALLACLRPYVAAADAPDVNARTFVIVRLARPMTVAVLFHDDAGQQLGPPVVSGATPALDAAAGAFLRRGLAQLPAAALQNVSGTLDAGAHVSAQVDVDFETATLVLTAGTSMVPLCVLSREPEAAH